MSQKTDAGITERELYQGSDYILFYKFDLGAEPQESKLSFGFKIKPGADAESYKKAHNLKHAAPTYMANPVDFTYAAMAKSELGGDFFLNSVGEDLKKMSRDFDLSVPDDAINKFKSVVDEFMAGTLWAHRMKEEDKEKRSR